MYITKSYLFKVLERFEMASSKSVKTLISQHFNLSSSQVVTIADTNYMSKVPFASAVGSLTFSMLETRLAYAISLVSKFMFNSGKYNCNAVKWILISLKGTLDYDIVYGMCRVDNVHVEGFVDSGYAVSIDPRNSITGYDFKVYGGVVSWKVGLQSVVEFDQDQITIHSDSQSALHLAKHKVFHEWSNHIDVKLHFLRDVVSSGKVNVVLN